MGRPRQGRSGASWPHSQRLSSMARALAQSDLVLREEPFRLRALADELGATLGARAEAKGLATEISIAADLPELVTGDRVRLRAALENLIDNAVKFTERGRRRAFRSGATRGTRGRCRVTFTVTDSGIGLSKKPRSRICSGRSVRPARKSRGATADRASGLCSCGALPRRWAARSRSRAAPGTAAASNFRFCWRSRPRHRQAPRAKRNMSPAHGACACSAPRTIRMRAPC